MIVSNLKPGVIYSVMIGSARVWLATNTFTSTGIAADKTVSTTKKIAIAKPVAETTKKITAPATRKIWANWPSLPDHFARHGGDFSAKDQDDYARMSWEFLQRAKAEGLPAKVDDEGVLRVFERKSGTFASYNCNGTTKTFFKPGSTGYFERQSGKIINLKNWKEE